MLFVLFLLEKRKLRSGKLTLVSTKLVSFEWCGKWQNCALLLWSINRFYLPEHMLYVNIKIICNRVLFKSFCISSLEVPGDSLGHLVHVGGHWSGHAQLVCGGYSAGADIRRDYFQRPVVNVFLYFSVSLTEKQIRQWLSLVINIPQVSVPFLNWPQSACQAPVRSHCPPPQPGSGRPPTHHHHRHRRNYHRQRQSN